MKTNAKVKKWGNSLALRLPSAIAGAAGIGDNTDVLITQSGSKLTIEPKTSHKMTLEKMLEGVTPENIHGELDWGSPVGKEIW